MCILINHDNPENIQINKKINTGEDDNLTLRYIFVFFLLWFYLTSGIQIYISGYWCLFLYTDPFVSVHKSTLSGQPTVATRVMTRKL